jgi:hypothetical protein
VALDALALLPTACRRKASCLMVAVRAGSTSFMAIVTPLVPLDLSAGMLKPPAKHQPQTYIQVDAERPLPPSKV